MLFLGLDSSTQSLTGLLIDLDGEERVWEESVVFDRDLPEWGTVEGVLPSDDPTVAHAPPLMWVRALELLLDRLAVAAPIAEIRAVTGAGQQHGSVYLNDLFGRALATLDPHLPVGEQIAPCLARRTAPIWQDTSTTTECTEIRSALGGVEATAKLSGSDTFERFTGPQIRRFWKVDPSAYENTAHIALVSSFLSSLLAGEISPLEPGDGAGTNLMDIAAGRWSGEAIEATAPDLASKLPPIVPSETSFAGIARWARDRWGFAADTMLLPWTGDNPSSLVGLGLVEAGQVGISLGTSDTYFACIQAPTYDPRGEGHVFGSPTGDWMTLNCFRNGSLTREHVRDLYGLDWEGFSAAIQSTPPANEGRLMLPWLEAEIVPRVARGGLCRSDDLDPTDGAANCRAVVEGQVLAMRAHATWMGATPDRIYVTGGASENRDILQILADVFACPVVSQQTTNGAAMGAALRAAHGYLLAEGQNRDWTSLVRPFQVSGVRVPPRDATASAYGRLARAYTRFERDNVARGRTGPGA